MRVALGHSMATYEQTSAALAEGLTGFTHLFNAMRPLQARDPGPIAAALEDPRRVLRADRRWRACRAGDAAPGAARRWATRCWSPTRCRRSAAPRGAFRLCGKDIVARDGRVTTEDGVLAGSALDMASAVRNCVRLLGVGLPEALRLARRPPRPRFSGSRTGSAASRRAVAPISSRSTPMRSGCSRPGSPARPTRPHRSAESAAGPLRACALPPFWTGHGRARWRQAKWRKKRGGGSG